MVDAYGFLLLRLSGKKERFAIEYSEDERFFDLSFTSPLFL
jgi:hypothetical protein